MVIYDKNQFTFNLIFILILIATIIINIIFGQNFVMLNRKYLDIKSTMSKIESNQDFNFIQGSHYDIEYMLTTQGFYVPGANDYGLFNGPSMQPVIFDGNTMIQKRYDGERLEEGHIVRFMRNDGQAVIHRVRADYGDTVYVQGDSLREGEIIDKSRITHLVIGVLFT
jgi:hypothetical protein